MTHGFQLKRDQHIPEINARVRLFEHARTGAQLLSVENDEENKVFGVTFATPPDDATGLPHILEHCVLNGSRKYPVKEPFVELIKGSLATFINAFTFSEKTMYPVASQNTRDFYNLIDVYMDAVFYPRIRPDILKQEGWHYELEHVDGPLTYKGVVFNEMKGAYSSPDRVMYERTAAALMPDTVYGVDSGGDPAVIPNLTFEQFQAFHERYYHPSNALFYFYGDDDPETRLELVDAFLVDFQRQPVDVNIAPQPFFSEPRRSVYPYDAGEDGKALVTVSWLLPEPHGYERRLSFQVLSEILTGSPASPLRKALLDSGLGEDVISYGLSDDTRQMYMGVGLKGVKPEDAEQVETLIVGTLEGLVRSGIDRATVRAAMNTVEFRLREQNTGQFPRGLFMFINAVSTWLYGGDPYEALAFDGPLQAVKRAIEAPDSAYFEAIIASHMLENTHRSTVILRPDATVREQRDAAETARLQAVRETLTEADLQALVEDTHRLRQLQETPDSPEALATLPMLKVDDLDKQIKRIPMNAGSVGDTPLLAHDLFTNGIVYLDLGMNLAALPEHLLPYSLLFATALLEVGTDSEDFVRLSQRIGTHTGGIRFDALTSETRTGEETAAWVFLRGKATVDNFGALLNILRDVLLTVKLDNRERFRQIVLQAKAEKESSLIPAGMGVIATRLRAAFSRAAWIDEQIEGIDYLFFLRRLAERIESDWAGVLADLEAVRAHLVNRNAMLVNVTLDEASLKPLRPQLADFVAALPQADYVPVAWNSALPSANEGLTIPAQVNYVGMGANIYALGYRYHGSFMAIRNYVRTDYLWEKIRVQGGAYGMAFDLDMHAGVLNFGSYRDPNLLPSLAVYERAAEYLANLDLHYDELSKAVIGAVGKMDAYQLPDAKGFTSLVRYLLGVSDADRQRWRDELLSTNVADFRAFANVLAALNQSPRVVVLGSADAIEAANAARPNLMKVTKVL